VLVTQLSDVFQYVFGKLAGRRKIAPNVSPGKTWEGLIGGGLSAVALGTALWWATPFTPAAAAVMSLILVIAGFLGGLVMSAVKRSVGAKDWGRGIPGHGGILDRLDSLLFAAPVFFHLTGFYLGTRMAASSKPPPWLESLFRLGM
jgi:phosphatidate cytidylyltransferase